jgi:hypothetical protein
MRDRLIANGQAAVRRQKTDASSGNRNAQWDVVHKVACHH